MMYSTPKHSYGKKNWRIVIKIDFFPFGKVESKMVTCSFMKQIYSVDMESLFEM